MQHFSTSLSLPSNFAWTNSAALAAIDRRGATVSWSPGSTAAFVGILGSAISDTGSTAGFYCRAPTGPGQFTIPAFILMAIPSGPGTVALEATSSQRSFSAPGIDFGSLSGRVTVVGSVRY